MYYIIEHNKRKDGIVNVAETGRATMETALSFYFERLSKCAGNASFVFSSVALVTEDLTILKRETVYSEYQTSE